MRVLDLFEKKENSLEFVNLGYLEEEKNIFIQYYPVPRALGEQYQFGNRYE